MAISEEEQMKAMLAEMGMDSMDDLAEESADSRPIPEGPVRKSVSIDEEVVQEAAQMQSIEGGAVDELPIDDVESGSVLQSSGADVNSSDLSDMRSRIPLGSAQHRDLTVTALLHLMGLPTGSQLTVLDSKLDLVMTKLSTLQAKIDRMNSQFELLTTTSGTERLEFQISEIRSIMKKFFPQAFSGGGGLPAQANKISATKSPAVIQSSEPVVAKENVDKVVNESPKKETSVHVDVGLASMAEEEEPLSDEDYQVLEAQKLRDQVKNQTK